MEAKPEMKYRFLGKTGIQVSVIGFGNMMQDKPTEESEKNCFDLMTTCFNNGINFFDTAEFYGKGNAEINMGKCLKKAGWARKDYVLTTKILRVGDGVNDAFLSRKHVIEGTLNSLKRLQADYVDLVFAHRYDMETPMEEVCRAFNWLIDHGKAFYWATSEWAPEQIMEANLCCERLDLIKPIADQCQYNMLIRKRMETELVPIYDKCGYGTTIWSPLAGGYLTGKYNDGSKPAGTRYGTAPWPKEMMDQIENEYVGSDRPGFLKKLNALGAIAKELNCTQAQLSLAWTLMNKDTSVAIVGATKVEQMIDNIGALKVMKLWTPTLEKRIEGILANTPEQPLNWRHWKPLEGRRGLRLDFDK